MNSWTAFDTLHSYWEYIANICYIYTVGQNGGNIPAFLQGKYNDLYLCSIIHSYLNGLDIFYFTHDTIWNYHKINKIIFQSWKYAKIILSDKNVMLPPVLIKGVSIVEMAQKCQIVT